MFRKLVVATACGLVAISAFAVDTSQVEKTIELKDGSSVYIFKDGKMAMETKTGQTARMKPGHVMEGKDGNRYIMVGDEVARLSSVLHESDRKR